MLWLIRKRTFLTAHKPNRLNNIIKNIKKNLYSSTAILLNLLKMLSKLINSLKLSEIIKILDSLSSAITSWKLIFTKLEKFRLRDISVQ